MTINTVEMTREEAIEAVERFIDHLCVDSESCMTIENDTDEFVITGIVEEEYDDEGDICDYVRSFTINGYDADEFEVLDIVRENVYASIYC